MAGVVRLRQPHDRQRRRPLLDDLGAEPLGHRAVAVDPLVQRGARRVVDRLAGPGRSCRPRDRPSRTRPGPGNRRRRARRWRTRSRSRHASAAARPGSARAGCGRSRGASGRGNRAAPAERQTSPSPSSSAIVLPSSPCRAGRQPVAIEAALARVVDGKTLRCAAKNAPRSPSSLRNGASSRRDQIAPQAVADDDDGAWMPVVARPA